MIFNVFEEATVEHPDFIGANLIKVKLDTGAFSSSIDTELAKDLLDYEDGKKITITSANGSQERKRVRGLVIIKGQIFDVIFNVTDRSNMKCKAIIGRRDLVGHTILVSPEDGNPENPMNITKKVNNE